jgi:protein-disulfide isomerase
MDSTYSPPAWFGFVLGILGGFAVSAGLVGVLIGYSMGGGVFGAAQYAQVPPAAPSDVPPAPQAPAVPAAKVDATKDHIRGNVKAPVSLIVYSDFECPFCKRFKPATDIIDRPFPSFAVS